MIHYKTRRLVRSGAMLWLWGSMAVCSGAGERLTAPVHAAVVEEVATQAPTRSGLNFSNVAAPVAGTLSPALVAQTSCGLNGSQGIQAEVLQAVNAVRAAGAMCGGDVYPATHALKWNKLLHQSAANHSHDMAQKQMLSHTSSNGGTLLQRLRDADYNFGAAGENIASGQGSVKEVIGSWLQSPGHCKNMLAPSYQEMGVACVRSNGARHDLYWTMNLGRR